MSEAPATPTQSGVVDWDDDSFTPAPSQRGGFDAIRFFRMSLEWPQKPFEDRKFQLGGKERVVLLEPNVYVNWSHRLSVKFMGSAVNGTRRCTLESRGHCVLCDHYETGEWVQGPDGKKKNTAKCSKRAQQFGLNLLVYKTNLDGVLWDEMNREILLDPDKGPVLAEDKTTPADLVYEVFLWRFNGEKFADIKTIKKEWGKLESYDLLLSLAQGKPDTFQDFSPQPMRQAAYRELMRQGDDGKKKAVALIDYYKEKRYDVEAILGKEYSDEEMAGFIGAGPTAAPDSAAINDVASSIEEEIRKAQAQPAPSPSAPEAAPAPAPAQPDVTSDFDSLLAGNS